MEAAHQILPRAQIDAGLTADSRVHLRQQRSRNLQHGYAAHEYGSQKSGHIVDDAAAESDDHAGPVSPALHHLLGHGFERREPFLRFTAGAIQTVMLPTGKPA